MDVASSLHCTCHRTRTPVASSHQQQVRLEYPGAAWIATPCRFANLWVAARHAHLQVGVEGPHSADILLQGPGLLLCISPLHVHLERASMDVSRSKLIIRKALALPVNCQGYSPSAQCSAIRADKASIPVSTPLMCQHGHHSATGNGFPQRCCDQSRACPLQAVLRCRQLRRSVLTPPLCLPCPGLQLHQPPLQSSHLPLGGVQVGMQAPQPGSSTQRQQSDRTTEGLLSLGWDTGTLRRRSPALHLHPDHTSQCYDLAGLQWQASPKAVR
jgi:hypothetical protein